MKAFPILYIARGWPRHIRLGLGDDACQCQGFLLCNKLDLKCTHGSLPQRCWGWATAAMEPDAPNPKRSFPAKSVPDASWSWWVSAPERWPWRKTGNAVWTVGKKLPANFVCQHGLQDAAFCLISGECVSRVAQLNLCPLLTTYVSIVSASPDLYPKGPGEVQPRNPFNHSSQCWVAQTQDSH